MAQNGNAGDEKEALRKIFAGGLNRATTDDAFSQYFSTFGNIVDSVVIKNQSGESRGFGYVTYDNSQSVDDALNSRPHTIDGKEVEIKRAIPRDDNNPSAHQRTKKMFMGGLSTSVTEDDIRNYLENKYSQYGKVDKVDLIRDKNTQAVKGYAFIDLDNEDLADRIIIEERYPYIAGKKCEIKKADPKGTTAGKLQQCLFTEIVCT